MTEQFIKQVHRTLDTFLTHREQCGSTLQEQATDKAAEKWIGQVTQNESYQLGFQKYYDNKKENDT